MIYRHGFCVLTMCILLSGCLAARPQQTLIHSGDQIPVTQFETIDGGTVRFQQGQKKLLILFNTWCPYSQAALKDMAQSDLVNKSDVTIVAVAQREGEDAIKTFREKQPISIHFVADFYRDIYSQFATTGVPRFYLINEQNRVVKEFFGWHDGAMSQFDWAP